jgi:LysM repeat protein
MVSKRGKPFLGGSLAWCKATFANMVWGTASIWMLMLGIGVTIACSPLEPINEPEVSDLQLTVETLKTSLRDAQRTIAELRTEVDSRRQELADVQIARAQLEGRVRETERRLVEARHVIDLQREELASSRSERARAARAGAVLQNQLKQLQKQLSKIGKPANDRRGTGVAPASTPPSRGRHLGLTPTTFEQPASTSPLFVTVESGDTLWSLSRQHRVPLKRLMAINQLQDSHIQVGQVLWLTKPAATGGLVEEKAD